jgi:hypothetical protein
MDRSQRLGLETVQHHRETVALKLGLLGRRPLFQVLSDNIGKLDTRSAGCRDSLRSARLSVEPHSWKNGRELLTNRSQVA